MTCDEKTHLMVNDKKSLCGGEYRREREGIATDTPNVEMEICYAIISHYRLACHCGLTSLQRFILYNKFDRVRQKVRLCIYEVCGYDGDISTVRFFILREEF